MGIFDDWFKSTKKTKNVKTKRPKKIETISKSSNADYKKDKILNERWIEHYFALQLFKPKDMTTTQFENYQEELVHEWIGKVSPAVEEYSASKDKKSLTISKNYLSDILKSISIKCYNIKDLPQEYFRALQYKNDITTDTAFLLVRFPSITKYQAENGFEEGFIRELPRNEKCNYKFSPIQSQKFATVSAKIEWQIAVFSGVQPHALITLINGINNEVIVTEYDGIQYWYYPLSKRAELYTKYPELEKMFGLPFPEFAKFLLYNKKNMINKEITLKYRAKNNIRIRNILKKYNIKI